MNNEINKTCCGGDYTAKKERDKFQTSPTKRHSAVKNTLQFLSLSERKRLANYISNYFLTEYYDLYGQHCITPCPIIMLKAINKYIAINNKHREKKQ